MIKIPKFMKEYAKYTKQSILNSELMKQEIKDKAIKKIDRVLQLTERGFITIEEGMKLIVICFG